jgi:tetratricopeptide (TPR) repeat protein
MAHHRLGQSVQARNLLQRGIREIEQRLPTIEGPVLAHYIPERWVIWCMLDIVRREAQDTVSGPDYERLDRADELVEAGNLSQAITELSQALDLQPYDPQLLAERGILYARLGQWKEASADYTKLAELRPTERINWLRAAPLPILAGDLERYREHCQKMLHQFGAGDAVSDGREAMIVKACLLVPGMVDDSRLPIETLVEALDDGLVPSARSKWTFTVLALAAYRSAEANKTVHWIRKSQQSQGYAEEPRVQVLALLLLAMAQHQLGQSEEASQALAEASALIAEHLPKLAIGELGGSWHDWLIAEILRREAAKVIAGLTEHPSPEASTASNVKTD